MLHINTYQCKNPIEPEEGWFGQPKYSTPLKNHPTLCRFSTFYWSACVVYTKTIIHLSVGESDGYIPPPR